MKFDFTSLKAEQVALLRIDSETGDVLDEKFELFLNDTQKAYTIFESVASAKTYIEKTIKPMRNVEAMVYDSSKEVIFYYDPAERN